MKWLLCTLGAALILAGSYLAAAIQTADGVRVEDIRFAGTGGLRMSALLYIPPNASAKRPAPGVLAVHGLINSREMQDGFAIELARRGYVVLALDMTGHGYSAPPAFANGWGGPDGLAYLRRLAFVDKDNIGLEGHSLGGAAVLSAALAEPNGYRALVLVGSTTGMPAVGSASFPRNAGYVLGRYDEFTPLMWGSKDFAKPSPAAETLLAKDVATTPKLRKNFGRADVSAGVLYGAAANGTARELYLPAVTHPGEHISTTAIGDVVDWFGKTLKGGVPRDGQIWYWKEAGTLIGFVGLIVLMLGVFDVLLGLPFFRSMIHAPEPARAAPDRQWWAGLIVGGVVPGLAFLPLMIMGGVLLPASALLPQTFTNQVMAWALGSLLISFGALYFFRARKVAFTTLWLPALAIGLATVGVGYLSLMLVDAVFHVDFRFWVLALKLMSPWQARSFALYLIPFGVFFFITLRGLQADLAVKQQSAARHYLATIVAMAGGVALLLIADYLPLATNDHLLVRADPLHPIMAFQFVPILAIVALISTFTYRRTNSYVPGATIATLFVTWYVVAGSATMIA
ncbi:MAG TPA: alpha/beta fold hydrolase [Rhizomicrobium sp.]|jgi:pimeloyl-ACP methyl ester carboxylesterase|nr:alpha/beta fold hydrolase [Rhizomicrobium sp.]